MGDKLFTKLRCFMCMQSANFLFLSFPR